MKSSGSMDTTRWLLVAGVLAVIPAGLGAQVGPLELVVERLEADPVGEVDLIVRTATAGALGSGAFTLEAIDRDGVAAAFSAALSAIAYASAGDATATAALDLSTQRIEITFDSPSGTLNEVAGPLVMIRLALTPGLQEDMRFELRIIPGTENLSDPSGAWVPAFSERGRLRLRPADPEAADIGPTGAEAPAGEIALFGLVTGRPFAIGSGTVEVVYDPWLADGPATLVIDPRYGSVTIDSVSEDPPGRIVATFTSPDGDLNSRLYGLVFAVSLPIRADAEVGQTAAVDLGAGTVLFDPEGKPLAIELEGPDAIEIIPANLVLGAAFEDGDLLEFTLTQ